MSTSTLDNSTAFPKTKLKEEENRPNAIPLKNPLIPCMDISARILVFN
jgi:hypothetical protein